MENIPEQINELILKFLQKEASPSEIEMLQSWLEEDEANRQYFKEINETFQATVTLSRFNHEKIDSAWQNLSQKIKVEKTLWSQRTAIVNKPFYNFLRIAASLSAIALITYYVLHNFYEASNADNKNATIYSTTAHNTHIILPDSSIVWLNTNSTLEYSSTFGAGSRVVSLKGEAFFDIKKNKQDFIVNTEKISIYVKGTKFNVRAYDHEADIETTLQEGKVELKVKGDREVYTMNPGDQITFNSSRKEVTINEVDPLDFSAWKEDRLVFDNTPLAEIIQKLENRYKVTITIDQRIASRERLTMTIENETIDEVLEFIKLSSQLKYMKDKNHILIYE